MAGDAATPNTGTRILEFRRQGDPAANDQLLSLLYAELRMIAQRHMQRERAEHTLQPTALVHEAFLRLTSGSAIEFADRAHFLRAASVTMRRVLVDHARARNATKRGDALCITLDESLVAAPDRSIDMLVLDDALTRLAAAEPRCAQVVELRFFAGLEVPEVAETLGMSTATVKRDWRFARAWLARELSASRATEET